MCSCCVSQAEARLAAKRAARAEARDIRMRELERQQKEVYNTNMDLTVKDTAALNTARLLNKQKLALFSPLFFVVVLTLTRANYYNNLSFCKLLVCVRSQRCRGAAWLCVLKDIFRLI